MSPPTCPPDASPPVDDQGTAVREEALTRATEVALSVRMVSSMMGGITEGLRRTTRQVESYETTVDGVRTVAHQLAGQMDRLVALSRQVGGVVELIENIALQTRMLSLNATIEAARAGEAGRGFAVVASAVRDLSRQTNGAIESIRGALTEIEHAALEASGRTSEVDAAMMGIRSTTRAIVESITEQGQVSEAASRYVDEAAQAVDGIAEKLAAPPPHPQHAGQEESPWH